MNSNQYSFVSLILTVARGFKILNTTFAVSLLSSSLALASHSEEWPTSEGNYPNPYETQIKAQIYGFTLLQLMQNSPKGTQIVASSGTGDVVASCPLGMKTTHCSFQSFYIGNGGSPLVTGLNGAEGCKCTDALEVTCFAKCAPINTSYELN